MATADGGGDRLGEDRARCSGEGRSWANHGIITGSRDDGPACSSVPSSRVFEFGEDAGGSACR